MELSVCIHVCVCVSRAQAEGGRGSSTHMSLSVLDVASFSSWMVEHEGVSSEMVDWFLSVQLFFHLVCAGPACVIRAGARLSA